MRRGFLFLLFLGLAAAAAAMALRPTGRTSEPTPPARATAIFAGGCFWCTESDFDAMPGVISTVSGYTGGRIANPTYEQVSAGGTGHYEAVLVVYDPGRISYAELARRFFPTIDAVDAGGQFCDRGEQYRSALFVANAAERRAAEAARDAAARRVGAPVATQILPRGSFYPAEDYHQDYHRRNPVRYRFYRWNCGRDARLERLWGRAR